MDNRSVAVMGWRMWHEANRVCPLPKFRQEIVSLSGERTQNAALPSHHNVSGNIAPAGMFLLNLSQAKVTIVGFKSYADQQCVTFRVFEKQV